MVFVLLGTKSRWVWDVETETYTTDLCGDATRQRRSRNKYKVATYKRLKQSHIWQTKPFGSTFPFTWWLRACLVGCLNSEVEEGKRRARAANSTHEWLERWEQLAFIVSQKISSMPHFTSQCEQRESWRAEQRAVNKHADKWRKGMNKRERTVECLKSLVLKTQWIQNCRFCVLALILSAVFLCNCVSNIFDNSWKMD